MEKKKEKPKCKVIRDEKVYEAHGDNGQRYTHVHRYGLVRLRNKS